MADQDKPTLDYAPPETKPQYSRLALICIGFAGAVAALINLYVATRLLGPVAILEFLGVTMFGLSMARPGHGAARRAFGGGVVFVPAVMLLAVFVLLIVMSIGAILG